MSPSPTNIKTNTRVEEQTQTKEKERRQHQPKPSDFKECPYCHAQVEKDCEFCPHCGHKLVDYCTFCGASMGRNDTECEECGMPVGGVTCPKCGTLNVRSFCRQCNEPLTRAAIRAIEKAKQDPKIQKTAALMDKAAELEEKINRLKSGKTLKTVKPTLPTLTKADLLVMEMLGTQPKQEEVKTEEVEETEGLEQLQEEFNGVMNDINSMLESLVPPNGSTPQEQFAFYSAQKVAIELSRTVVKRQVETVYGWVCNFCGCFHREPSCCAKPCLGGTWMYRDEVTFKKIEEKYTVHKFEN